MRRHHRRRRSHRRRSSGPSPSSTPALVVLLVVLAAGGLVKLLQQVTHRDFPPWLQMIVVFAVVATVCALVEYGRWRRYVDRRQAEASGDAEFASETEDDEATT